MEINTLAKKDLYEYSTSTLTGPLLSVNAENSYDDVAKPLGHLKTGSSKRNIVVFQDWNRPTRIKEQELEWWLGKVIEIHDEHFTASMEDLPGRTNIVEFEKDVIDPNDKELLFIGSKFTYSISVIDKPTGREYITRLAFSARRIWLKEYAKKAKELAEEIFPEKLLNLE